MREQSLGCSFVAALSARLDFAELVVSLCPATALQGVFGHGAIRVYRRYGQTACARVVRRMRRFVGYLRPSTLTSPAMAWRLYSGRGYSLSF
ncbi:hypothetical protein GQ44DRAFT_719337 [Phaeosphaeriaceae sp. PMI808]|nr:hypothetical protein GQ44DRAFT_719337 [Phaeosphaeriaceae sp. PMI808]